MLVRRPTPEELEILHGEAIDTHEESGILDLDLDGLEDLTGAKITDIDDRHPFRFYTLAWPNGDHFRIYRNGDWLVFEWLESAKGQERLTRLVSTLPAFFRERGIKIFATSEYEPSQNAMLKVGFEPNGQGYLLHDISKGCRMDQYAAWKRGECDEPEWRSKKPKTGKK